MEALAWIVGGGIAMAAIALVGSATLLLREATLARILTPLVAFAAGSLVGGAFFHMLPAALGTGMAPGPVFATAFLGFTAFFALEQFLHWHHCHREETEGYAPLGTLVLVGDGLHNFLGGIGVAGVFLVDVRLGVLAWLAAAAHEVPQELGDFGVLVHSGIAKRRALLLNVLSGLTFLVGGLVAWALSGRVDPTLLVPFAAGSFLYIASSDLIPEIRGHEDAARNALHFATFVGGAGLLWGLGAWLG